MAESRGGSFAPVPEPDAPNPWHRVSGICATMMLSPKQIIAILFLFVVVACGQSDPKGKGNVAESALLDSIIEEPIFQHGDTALSLYSSDSLLPVEGELTLSPNHTFHMKEGYARSCRVSFLEKGDWTKQGDTLSLHYERSFDDESQRAHRFLLGRYLINQRYVILFSKGDTVYSSSEIMMHAGLANPGIPVYHSQVNIENLLSAWDKPVGEGRN